MSSRNKIYSEGSPNDQQGICVNWFIDCTLYTYLSLNVCLSVCFSVLKILNCIWGSSSIFALIYSKYETQTEVYKSSFLDSKSLRLIVNIKGWSSLWILCCLEWNSLRSHLSSSFISNIIAKRVLLSGILEDIQPVCSILPSCFCFCYSSIILIYWCK